MSLFWLWFKGRVDGGEGQVDWSEQLGFRVGTDVRLVSRNDKFIFINTQMFFFVLVFVY